MKFSWFHTVDVFNLLNTNQLRSISTIVSFYFHLLWFFGHPNNTPIFFASTVHSKSEFHFSLWFNACCKVTLQIYFWTVKERTCWSRLLFVAQPIVSLFLSCNSTFSLYNIDTFAHKRIENKMTDSKYFTTTKKGEIFELKSELNSDKKEKKKEAVKKVRKWHTQCNHQLYFIDNAKQNSMKIPGDCQHDSG